MNLPTDLVLLGEGPAASVYADGDDLAIKVYPGSLDRETRSAFDRERSNLLRVPSTLRVEDIRELPDGRTALLMPRCAQSLAGLVSQVGGLSADDIAAVGGAVTTALAAAHRAGVTHGGLSPHNVLLRTSGEPVVADFGLALRHRFATADSTVDYLAPETVRKGLRNERSDLYGLGAVLYFALTGESPFPAKIGERSGARVLRVLGDPAPPIERPDVPGDLVALIAGLLAKDPGLRPGIDEVVELLTGGESTLELPDEPLVEIGPSSVDPRRRRAKHVSALAITGGVAILALGRLLLSGQDPPPPQPPPTSAPAKPVRLELDPPIDHDDYVELTWRAPGEFYFSVLIEGDAEPRVQRAGSNHSLTVRVEPGRKYCFRLQASVPTAMLTSEPRPLRGADCR